MVSRAKRNEVTCKTWNDLIIAVQDLQTPVQRRGEMLWFRGAREHGYGLVPSLMRITEQLSDEDHHQIESDLFFEFQARAAELRVRGLSDWECLFFSRHYGLPTRVLDWTDTFAIALYFSLENWVETPNGGKPALWVLDPYALNEKTWDIRDIILPRNIGWDADENDYWDFGEMLATEGKWDWDGPVAIYPIQINDRVRAQRGWFTIHGNDRRPLEQQFPKEISKLVLDPNCIKDARHFLALAGLNRFSIYPDLDNLALWLREQNTEWAKQLRATRTAVSSRKQRPPAQKGASRAGPRASAALKARRK